MATNTSKLNVDGSPAPNPMYSKRGEAGYVRIADDAYFTPPWCVHALLEHVKLPKAIWEPAVGDGAIAKVLVKRGHDVYASDIKDYGYPGTRLMDFLKPRVTIGHSAVVTNPPYELAAEFVEEAINQTHIGEGMVCMLLRNEFDSAKSRLHLFDNHVFAGKLVLTQRPHWTANRTASPRHNFAWFIWNWRNTDPARLHYQRTQYKRS